MKIRQISKAIYSFLLIAPIAMAATPQNEGPDGQGSNNQASSDAPRADRDAALLRARQKFAHAVRVADRFKDQAVAAGVTGDQWRFDMIANLMRGPEQNFSTVANADSYLEAVSAAANIARTGRVAVGGEQANSLNSQTYDLVYVPITPCRILDTRAAAGAGFVAGQIRTYVYSASNPGNGACSVTGQVPSGGTPAAFAANVTVDETGLSGFLPGSALLIYPQGTTSATSFINFGPGQILANAGIISLNQANGQFTVQANAPANVIIDNYGVFIEPEDTALECTTATSTSSFLGVVAATCPATYTLTGGGCRSSSLNDHTYQGYPSSETTYGCGFYPETGGTIGATLTAYARCCRVPGR